MSQFYQGTTSGSLPPAVPLEFTTDINSPAIPVANNLNLVGGFTGDNSDNGIRTDGGNGSDTLTVQLTNRIFGGVGTSGAATSTAASYTLNVVPAVYTFEIKVAGYDQTTPSGVGFSLFCAVISDGVTATKIGVTDKIKNAQAPLATCDADITTSNNDVEIEVTGVAGLDIIWTVVGYYVQGLS